MYGLEYLLAVLSQIYTRTVHLVECIALRRLSLERQLKWSVQNCEIWRACANWVYSLIQHVINVCNWLWRDHFHSKVVQSTSAHFSVVVQNFLNSVNLISFLLAKISGSPVGRNIWMTLLLPFSVYIYSCRIDHSICKMSFFLKTLNFFKSTLHYLKYTIIF